MNNVKNKLSHKLLAAFLSLVMVLSIVPASLIAQAATVSHPDAVTITVVDDITGEPIEGAKVSYVIYDNDLGTEVQGDDEVPTDANGEVVILDTEPGNIMISSVTVTHDDYYEYANDTYNQTVTSLQDNFEIKMSSRVICDVTVSGVTTEYNGTEKELVSITGDYDKVTYTYDGNPTDTVPTAKNVGEYEVEVYLEKTVDGVFKTLNKTVTSKITPKDIEITIKKRTVAYNENEQELVEFTGAFEIGDIVTWTVESDVTTWTVDDTNISDKKIPTAMAVGEYDVSLNVVRENHKELNLSVTSEIVLGEINLGDLSIKANDLTYNGSEQEALTITDQGNYKLMYQFADSKENLQETAWTEYDNDNKPMVKDAGEYIIFVKAVKENYNDKETEAYPISVSVAKAQQTLSFDDSSYVVGGTSSYTVTAVAPFVNNTYDFAATDRNNFAGGTVTYSIVLKDEDADIAIINSATGLLTVTHPGVIKVVATLSGNSNYDSCTIDHTIEVIAGAIQGEYVKFAYDTVAEYIVGQNSGVVVENKASKTVEKDKGNISYKVVDGESLGLAIDNNGKVTVDDYTKLIAALNAGNGSLNYTVQANKKEVKNWLGKIKYPADYASYVGKIKFLDTPTDAITDSGTKGLNDWYIDEVIITPASGLTVAKTEVNKKGDNFSETVSFNNQGTAERIVYLKDATGGITAPVVVNVKIDTIAPDTSNMNIEIQELSPVEKLGVKFGFYNPTVNIKFTVEDELGAEESGLDHIEWFYTKDANATSSILADKSGILSVTEEDGKYVATLPITASETEQFRGHIAFKSYDKANNASDEVKENNYIIVVDTINPNISADFKLVDSTMKYNKVENNGVTQHYYNDEVEFTFTVKEANFFEDDVNVVVTKDGINHPVNVSWTHDDELHYGKFKLSDDGDYVVKMDCKDQTENVMVDSTGEEISLYTSEIITIDTEAPKIDSVYIAEDRDGDGRKEIQNITITIDEHNFRVSDTTVEVVDALDINGNTVSVNDIQAYVQNEANWTSNGDIHTLVLESSGENKILVDAIYNLTIDYTDLSLNPAETKIIKNAIIDNTEPDAEKINIEYSRSVLDIVLQGITLGFYNYNPTVEVTFTAEDETAGIRRFDWFYNRQDGASETILEKANGELTVTPNGNVGTAKLTLPLNEAEQLRGHISVQAIDDYGNKSDIKTDNDKVIIVDTIAPKMTVIYSTENNKIGTRTYYKDAVNVTLNVTEANFFEDDVNVTVSKDEAEAEKVDVQWDDESVDVHTGTFTISGDGDYVVYVEYKDKSNNYVIDAKKEPPEVYSYKEGEETVYKYKSHIITIDTIEPVIDVEYDDDIVPVANTLVDNDGNERKYYAKEKTATVTINEHNFDPNSVVFTITAKDVTGAELDADALNEKKAWSDDGDIHTMTITYPGDANYTFDIKCADKAGNEYDDYATDYFTVDNSKPVNSVVEYSTSVLDTVLESITFGFYNAKMTVKLTVEDNISEVHSFRYSYLNAGDVSSVNAELIDEEIQAEDIEYSDDRKTATATFEIPKLVLENDNQFNGTVEFTATNRAGLTTDIHKETKRIVVDNIAPTAQVSYNEPINSVGGVSYYDGDINATVVINEANFYANEVKVMVSKDGAEATPVSPVWTDNSTDIHTGTFTLTEDGDYVVTIVYADYSSNEMTTYTSNQLTIDTDIQAPTYSINGVAKTEIGGSYQDKATVAFNFEDQNFDTNTIKLTRTRFDKVEDVTSKFIKVANNDKGGSGSFTIPSEVGNDGIYVLTIGMTDKAKHTTESQIKFTINRFGSVYEYSDDLVALIRDGGQYVQSVDKDLVITEYNANRLLEGSLKILITRDGEAIDVDYSSNPANINSQVNIGDSGWYQYVYTIKASNFDKDGVYKISLTSAYSADDSKNNESTSVPENSIDGLGNDILDAMNFTVDATAPEIRNIVNLDESIADVDKIVDGKLNVKYTVVDIGGLKSIEILLNGTAIQTLTTEDFIDDAFSYSGSFDISEQDSTTAQKVQFIVTDLAGNVTDTDSEEFLKAHSEDNEDSTYIFFNEVTVSRNFLVRWYADKPLFWGSIIGVIVLTGAIWFFIVAKKKKKEEKK